VSLFRGRFTYPNARPAFFSMIPGPSILRKKHLTKLKLQKVFMLGKGRGAHTRSFVQA
jgi:hypothetical protein